MVKAYDGYAAQYESIIKKLVRALWTTGDSMWNSGPMSNGTIDSVRQQLRLDLMILGELFKDVYRAQKGAGLPPTYFNSQPEPAPLAAAAATPSRPNWSLLDILGKGGVVVDSATGEKRPVSVLEWNRVAPLIKGLGAQPAPASVAILENAQGKELARVSVPGLAAPLDLKPKTAKVELKGDWKAGYRVRIKAEGAEITQLNNLVVAKP